MMVFKSCINFTQSVYFKKRFVTSFLNRFSKLRKQIKRLFQGDFAFLPSITFFSDA